MEKYVPDEREFAFAHVERENWRDTLLPAVERITSAQRRDKPFILLCVGSDASVQDCFGPIVGTMLSLLLDNSPKDFFQPPKIYGSLAKPVTAMNLPYMADKLSAFSPKEPLIVIDSALSDKYSPGTLFFTASPTGFREGRLLGDYSLLGVTADKSTNNNPYGTIRLSVVYKMAVAACECLFSALPEFPKEIDRERIFSLLP